MLWFVILVAVNLQSAFLTPPFGFALFYMKGTVPPSVTMVHIYRGIVPFVVLQVLTVAICMIWPEIILWLPRDSASSTEEVIASLGDWPTLPRRL